MDDVKERLGDAIGPEALAIPDKISEAAVRQIVSLARELLTHGVNVIVEGFFQSDRYSNDFAELASLADSVLIHILAEDSVLKHRYETRAISEDRHWIHGDREKLGTLMPRLPSHLAARLHLDIPQITIDTTNRTVDTAGTVLLIRQARRQHSQGRSV